MSSVLIPPVGGPPNVVDLTVVGVCGTTVTLSWQWSGNGCYNSITIDVLRVDGDFLPSRTLGFEGYDRIEWPINLPCSCTVEITVRAALTAGGSATFGGVSQPVIATATGIYQ